ncbi:SEC-C domain-containing protein [Streptomyces sp. DSM 40750]|uniref:SEC-C domain-containing protein n=1 Tax=Streptomyces sp. DSM 40750 TaxID=2801030 RepID=UPI00214C9684|nr:SEC-C domain-containing protein [Streptomyces sp. DSM 40750]UUU21016.1 SEC-C domain-containing protein [Streptomyces sp. DSM 40750]
MSSKHRTGGKNGKNKKTHGSRRTPARLPSPPPRMDAQVAEECERLAEQYPEDREQLLLEAAGEWGGAGEHARAVALYERLLGQEGDEAVEEPDLVDAFRISALWDAGRDEEARAAAAAFRRRHPRHAGAWNVVAEAFEARDENATAAEWFTAGVTHTMGVGTPVTVDTVEADSRSYDIEMLVIGRHRVRRVLGEPHDDWDEVADALHERRAVPLLGRVRPLDEMHDPLRPKRIAEGDTECLEMEIEALAGALHKESSTVPGGLRKTCVLYWPPEEFARLLERWPNVADAYGNDPAEHLRQVERTLRELSDQGGTHLAVGRATVRGLEAYGETEGGAPDAPSTRSAYAADLARTGQATDWPPPRNAPCWCGSERKYKKCCGNPALT